VLLVWAPLPFGSVTPSASARLAAAAFVVLALALWAPVRPARALPRAVWLAASALAAVGLLGALQSLPLPAALAAALSPRHAELARGAAESLGAPEPARIALSLAPDASRNAAFDWAAAGAVLAAAALVGASRRARRLLLGTVALSVLFQVLFGAQQWFARSSTLWGVDLPDLGPRLRGTFVNPNHAALYLEIGLAAAFAWAWWQARRAAQAEAAEERLLRLGGASIAWLALFAGLAFTRSRAGLLAALAATALQGAWVGTRRRRLWLAASGLAAGLAGLALVSWLGFQEGLGRLVGGGAEGLSPGGRVEAMAATAELWGRFPILGTGLGSFRAAFPMVQPEGRQWLWRHAHSDWLELGATAGLLGFGLVLAGLVAVARRLARLLVAGERSEDRGAALAAAGALVAVGLHSFVDFGLTIPANAVTLAALVGAALAAREKPAANSAAAS